MHPESHSLESSFEPAGEAVHGPASRGVDPVVEDFNAFFERLSALDDLQWSAEAAPTPAKSADLAAAGPQAAPRAKARPHRMTVVKSEAVAAPVAVPPIEPAVPAGEERVSVGDVARFLKTTLVGLVLFALGLAAGWAALSLPGHFHHHMPTLTQLVERARSITLPHLGHAPAGTAAAPAATANAATTAQATAAHDATQPAAAAPKGPDAIDPDAGLQLPKLGDTIQIASGTHARHAAPATAHRASAAPAAVAASGPAAHRAAPHEIAAHGSASSHPAAPAGPRYTLQVGACTSYSCVEAYQRLLQSKVDPHTIKVVTQPRAGAPNLQRVRIQPLQHGQAERLKSELAALDPRFKGAYLIALH